MPSCCYTQNRRISSLINRNKIYGGRSTKCDFRLVQVHAHLHELKKGGNRRPDVAAVAEDIVAKVPLSS